MMRMKILRVVTKQQKALAKQLARGRIFATGKAFTPFARAKVYNSLLELARDTNDAEAGGPDIGAVSAVSPAAATPLASAAQAADASSASAHPSEGEETSGAPQAKPRPQSCDEIGLGSVVLATTGGVGDGWFEAFVVSINGEALTLKWRDYPAERNIVRRRTQLALLPADQN